MPATPRNLRTGADATEAARIFQMAPASMQAAATTLAATLPTTTKEQIVAGLVVDFQTFVAYGVTSTFVSEADVTSFVQARTRELSGAQSGIAAFKLTQFQSGNVKTLLLTYFGIAPSTMQSPGLSQANLVNALNIFRDNLLEYKLTGSSSYKRASDGAKAWLDRYLQNLNLQVNTTADSLTTQVNSYTSANPELIKAQTDFQTLKTEGPKVEDTYQTIRRQMNQTTAPPDMTGLYVKAGIAGGLVLGAIALTFV
jgi:hypothetical protein